MDWLKRVENTANAFKRDITGGADTVADGAKSIADQRFVKDSVNIGVDVALAGANTAGQVGTAVAHLPGDIGTWGRVAGAIESGKPNARCCLVKCQLTRPSIPPPCKQPLRRAAAKQPPSPTCETTTKARAPASP